VALNSEYVQVLKDSLKADTAVKEYITLVRGSTPEKW